MSNIQNTSKPAFRTTMTPDNVKWEMDWSRRNEDGTRAYPDQPEKEIIFESGRALALLLINDVVFLNTKEREEGQQEMGITVDCSDLFAWGCSDAECMQYAEMESLYDAWLSSPVHGSDIWCMIKRREMPQDAIAEGMVADGIDLEALRVACGLRTNYAEGVSEVIKKLNYEAYETWCLAEAKEARSYDDAEWWTGFLAFSNANPGSTSERHAEEMRRIEAFKVESGYADDEQPISGLKSPG